MHHFLFSRYSKLPAVLRTSGTSAGFNRLRLFRQHNYSFRVRNVPDDFAYGRNNDASGQRVFDAEDRRDNRGLHFAAFKGQVTFHHFTVNELQSLAVAQRLRADDFTVFKGNVLAVPCQIFAFYNTVADCDVFGMPESILGIEDAVFKKGIRKKPAASNRRLCAAMAGRQKARDCCGCLKDGQAYFLTPSCTAGAKAPCRHFSKRKRPPL